MKRAFSAPFSWSSMLPFFLYFRMKTLENLKTTRGSFSDYTLSVYTTLSSSWRDSPFSFFVSLILPNLCNYYYSSESENIYQTNSPGTIGVILYTFPVFFTFWCPTSWVSRKNMTVISASISPPLLPPLYNYRCCFGWAAITSFRAVGLVWNTLSSNDWPAYLGSISGSY